MKIYVVPVGEDGQIVLPQDLRERLGVGDGGQIVLVAEDQDVRLHPQQGRASRLDAWLGAAPSGGDRGELEAIRHAGMDEAELRIVRAGPGARVTRIELVSAASVEPDPRHPDRASGPDVQDQAPVEENPFLLFLGAAPLPEGMTTEDFIRETRGASDPSQQTGPGATVVQLDDHLRRKP